LKLSHGRYVGRSPSISSNGVRLHFCNNLPAKN
jgi:hypothetical protein